MTENLNERRRYTEHGKRIPRWEHELWSYVSAGDGDKCPVHDNCPIRLAGGSCYCPVYDHSQPGGGNGWCIGDHNQGIVQVIDGTPCCSVDCYLANYDLIEHKRPGTIFKLVEMLAQKYLKMGRVDSPPVPASLLALADRQRSIEIRMVPLKAYHGAIWRLGDTWVIQLNKNDTPSRGRLTLFHEAFHILAHCRATPVFEKRNGDKGSFNELLAENFAHHLLMPRRWVEQKWEEVEDPGIMADIFDVPESSMSLRLKTLHLI